MSLIEDRLSLSTCWCSSRHTDGYEMAVEMADLGFKWIELSHGIRISLVPGLLKAVEDGVVGVSSVHNFCPLPNGVQSAAPNLYQPSSSDARERDLWVRYTRQTIKFAVKMGAGRVVMHSGSLWFFLRSPETRLEKWIDASGLERTRLAGDEGFAAVRDRAMKRIRKRAPKFMRWVTESYGKVLTSATEDGVRLCLENREGLEELPLDEAFHAFLEELPEPEYAAYWHDTGHAQIKHQLGLLDHRAFLGAMAPRLAGFHLHDVTEEGRDHQTPGSGTVDFQMVREFIRPEHTLVVELSPKLATDEVKAARDYLARALA